jgi:DNA-binding transcriptional regulator YdaS (Cro superfamily)
MTSGRHGPLSDEQVVTVREMYAAGEADQPTLARMVGVTESSIAQLVRGERYASAGGPLSRRADR